METGLQAWGVADTVGVDTCRSAGAGLWPPGCPERPVHLALFFSCHLDAFVLSPAFVTVSLRFSFELGICAGLHPLPASCVLRLGSVCNLGIWS